jgi:hypothetical protein
MFSTLSRAALFVLADLVVCLGLAIPARACEPAACCTYKTVTCYETVTVMETRTEPYTRTVKMYDDCGRAYCVTRVCYREVEVPATKVVAVNKRVKVCD